MLNDKEIYELAEQFLACQNDDERLAKFIEDTKEVSDDDRVKFMNLALDIYNQKEQESADQEASEDTTGSEEAEQA